MSARRVWARICSDLLDPKSRLAKPEFKSCRVSGQSTRLKLADESYRSHPDKWRDEYVLEIRADHSTLPRLSSLVTRVGTRWEREQRFTNTTGLVCATVAIGAS